MTIKERQERARGAFKKLAQFRRAQRLALAFKRVNAKVDSGEASMLVQRCAMVAAIVATHQYLDTPVEIIAELISEM